MRRATAGLVGMGMLLCAVGCDSGEASPLSASASEARDFREIDALGGHGDAVSCVAFSADGKLMASGSNDKTVKLWDVESRKETRTITGHSAGVFAVAFSPDGRFVASAGGDPRKSAAKEDFAIHITEVGSGNRTRTLQEHTKIVTALAFNPLGGTLASASNDGTIKVWDLTAARVQTTISTGSSAVLCVSYSGDGKLLAAGGQGEIRLIATEGHRELARLKEHTDFVSGLGLSGDGTVLASGSFDKSVRVWNVSERRAVRTLTGHTDAVQALALTKDGKLLATAGYDKKIRLWEVASGSELKALEGHNGFIAALAFSPNGRLLASASGDKTVKLWSAD